LTGNVILNTRPLSIAASQELAGSHGLSIILFILSQATKVGNTGVVSVDVGVRVGVGVFV
jgi:hypothetical protein